MRIHQLRHATMILELAHHRFLVDPMLGEASSMPGLKFFGGGRRRNPLVPLPAQAHEFLETITSVLLTHEHPDHFDPTAKRWARKNTVPIWANAMDVPHLRKNGFLVSDIQSGLDLQVEVVAGRHGKGIVGWLLGPVSGYYLDAPNEPTVFLTGDTILTETMKNAIVRLSPDVVVAPAGAANFGIGPDILFSVDELMELASLWPGALVLNHLEAFDHCPTTRAELRRRVVAEGFEERIYIPEDGEVLTFDFTRSARPPVQDNQRRPGFQKWLTGALMTDPLGR